MKVILVHGTFDGDVTQEGDRWWQRGGAMRRELEADGFEVEAFQWSGENSDTDRMAAAKALIAVLEEPANADAVILAHSHGGNVVREAFRLSDDTTAQHMLSVGTPFIDRARPLYVMLLEGARFWQGIRYLTLLAIAFMALGVVGSAEPVTDSQTKQLMQFGGGAVLAVSLLLAALIALRIVIRVVKSVVARGVAYEHAAKRIHSIAHEEDEAISFLSVVRKSNIRVVTIKSLSQSIRNNAEGAFNRILIVAFLGALVYFGFRAYGGGIVGEAQALLSGYDAGDGVLRYVLSFGLFVVAGFVVLFPLIVSFSLLGSFILRALAGLTARPIASILAPVVNHLTSAAVITNALGMDSGFPVKRVDDQAAARERMTAMPPELAQRIADHANETLASRVALLRRALTSKPERTGDVFAEIQETFTWDELIHTAYFRVPECRAFIRRHLATMCDREKPKPRTSKATKAKRSHQAGQLPDRARGRQAATEEAPVRQYAPAAATGAAEARAPEHQGRGNEAAPLEMLRRSGV